MTLRTMTLSLILTAASILLTGGCKENAVDPPRTDTTIWKEVEQFRGVDIRYMLVHDGALYVSACRPQPNGWQYTFALMKTVDGDHWDTLKVFERWIGPIAFHGDTLTILEDGRTWKYHPSSGWEVFWKHLMTAKYAKDMVWLNNTLYVFENTYSLSYDYQKEKSIDNLFSGITVSRFVKYFEMGKEVAVTRPFYVYQDNIVSFDGVALSSKMEGIAQNTNSKPNYPSLFVFDGRLYAGFNNPSIVKIYTDSGWVNYSDSIPNSKYANRFTPSLTNYPTAITFINDRLFVSTEYTGVLELTSSGWHNLESGLPGVFPSLSQYELKQTIPFLMSLKNKLFVGYGEPWSGPVPGSRGVYYCIP